ncbi:hypothetical protein [Streptomyces spiralis]
MANHRPADDMAQACARFAALKAGLSPDTPRRNVERTAFTHALHCPTCTPIADQARHQLADRIAHLEAEGQPG